jgi:hypothetical protein
MAKSLYLSRKLFKTMFATGLILGAATACTQPNQVTSTIEPTRPPTGSQNQKQTKCWVLIQEDLKTGPWHVLLAEDRMIATNLQRGITYATRAPKWDLLISNRTTRRFFQSSLGEWHTKTDKPDAILIAGQMPGGQVQTTSTSEPKLQPNVIKSYKVFLWILGFIQQDDTGKGFFERVFQTPVIEPPVNQVHLLAQILPIVGGGERSQVTKIKNIYQAEITTFPSVPEGYKQTDSEIGAMLDKKSAQAMQNIMDDLAEDLELDPAPSNGKHPTKP